MLIKSYSKGIWYSYIIQYKTPKRGIQYYAGMARNPLRRWIQHILGHSKIGGQTKRAKGVMIQAISVRKHKNQVEALDSEARAKARIAHGEIPGMDQCCFISFEELQKFDREKMIEKQER